jgi:hypothetical protein
LLASSFFAKKVTKKKRYKEREREREREKEREGAAKIEKEREREREKGKEKRKRLSMSAQSKIGQWAPGHLGPDLENEIGDKIVLSCDGKKKSGVSTRHILLFVSAAGLPGMFSFSVKYLCLINIFKTNKN